MMRLPLTPRPVGLAILFSIAVAAACGDGTSPLRAAAGYYRLVSVNGQPLPYLSPPSVGPFFQIWRGDLVLRPNGTFASGVGGNIGFGFLSEGTYQLSNQQLTLRAQGATEDGVARVSGDSIHLSFPNGYGQTFTFAYRRAQLTPNTVPLDRYRLRSIDGRTQEPLVEYDETINNQRSVGYVAYDSLIFSDGVFFRRHRSESAVGYIDGQPALASASEWTTWGAYESGPGWVVLLYYSPPSPIRARDSLSIAADTLVRRTPLITGIREERYARP